MTGLDSRGYPMPELGWTCYHCGETFTTWGSAQDHFGATPEAKPGCLIKVQYGNERGLEMELRKAEAEIERLKRELAGYEQAQYELQCWTSEFGSLHEVRCKLDSLQGRVAVYDCVTDAFRQRAPELFAEVIG